MDFQTVLEELNRLYESEDLVVDQPSDPSAEAEKVEEPEKAPLKEDSEDFEETDEMDDAVEEEEESESQESQLVLECSKCGGLIIKDEADVKVDDATDLANVEDACQYCEAEEGYKIIGTFISYDSDEALEEGIFSKKKAKVAGASKAVQDPKKLADAKNNLYVIISSPLSGKIKGKPELSSYDFYEDSRSAQEEAARKNSLADGIHEYEAVTIAQAEARTGKTIPVDNRYLKEFFKADEKQFEDEELEELLDFDVPISLNANVKADGNAVNVGTLGA